MVNTKNIMSLKELKRWLRNEKDFLEYLSHSPIAEQISKKKIKFIKKEIQIRSKQLCVSTDEGWYQHDHLNKQVMTEWIKGWTAKLQRGETI